VGTTVVIMTWCGVWDGERLFKHPLPSTLKAVAGSFLLSLGLHLFVLLLLNNYVRCIMPRSLDSTPILSSVLSAAVMHARITIVARPYRARYGSRWPMFSMLIFKTIPSFPHVLLRACYGRGRPHENVTFGLNLFILLLLNYIK